jgi:hypothetical protein
MLNESAIKLQVEHLTEQIHHFGNPDWNRYWLIYLEEDCIYRETDRKIMKFEDRVPHFHFHHWSLHLHSTILQFTAMRKRYYPFLKLRKYSITGERHLLSLHVEQPWTNHTHLMNKYSQIRIMNNSSSRPLQMNAATLHLKNAQHRKKKHLHRQLMGELKQ